MTDLLDRIATAIERANDRVLRRGIAARTHLPSPAYDALFELREIDGRMLCVMRPGTRAYDKHYFETVPL